MKVRVVLFHRPKNLVSKAIRLFTGSYWNHAGFLYKNNDGEYYFIEAVENGIMRLTMPQMTKKYGKICEIKFLPEVDSDFDLTTLIGIKYQFSIFWTFPLFVAIKRVFGTTSKITNYFSCVNNDNRYYCFELVAEVTGKINSHLADGFYFDDKKIC